MTVEAARPRVGSRPRPRLSASRPSSRAADSFVLALDLGASRIRAAVVAKDGRVLARDARPTPAQAGPEPVIAACVAALEAARDGSNPTQAGKVIAVGVAAPGPLDPATGCLLEPPNLGPAFRDMPLAVPLAEATGLPVALQRDTNVAALAEGAFGAARGIGDYLYITVSTGIGGAIVSDGRLLAGAGGLAGELGHVSVDLDGPPCGCGGRGHLEALSSGSGIARAAREAIAEGRAPILAAHASRVQAAVGAREVAEAELAGDPAAVEIMGRARRAFAAAVVGFVDVFDPVLIVIGGSLAREQGERWLGPTRTAVRQEAFRTVGGRVRIVAAELGDDVGLVGAIPLLASGVTLHRPGGRPKVAGRDQEALAAPPWSGASI